MQFTFVDIPAAGVRRYWLAQLREMGFSIALLSNNTKRRVRIFNETMQFPVAHMAIKPFTFVLRRVMRKMGTAPAETVMIGDQLFTDILCGMRAGCTTVMVKPLTDKDFLTVRVKRGLERHVMRRNEMRK